MNKRQKKKFFKKKGLKRYDTLSKLHANNKCRLLLDGRWVTATVGIMNPEISRNRRVYSMSLLKEALMNASDDALKCRYIGETYHESF